ncbi:MAG: hypothetical protein ACK4PR_10495 [Gammaproteobacteria bacterium]
MDKKQGLMPTKPESVFSPSIATPDLRAHFPQFTVDSKLLAYIQNSRFDAEKFCYDKPYVILGKAGFVVDVGYRLGYVVSTWQGIPNPSFRYQDLQLVLQLAIKRTRDSIDYNQLQLGWWDRSWIIGGEDTGFVELLTKMRNDYARNALS